MKPNYPLARDVGNPSTTWLLETSIRGAQSAAEECCGWNRSRLREKFGGLRFYVNCRRNEAIRQRIGIAADESFHTCEVCGQPGKLREERSIKTLCDEHAGIT